MSLKAEAQDLSATRRWRRDMVGSRLAREVHSLQHRVLMRWRLAVADRARLGHALHQVLQRRSFEIAGATFAAWHTVVTAKARHRQLLSKAVLRWVCLPGCQATVGQGSAEVETLVPAHLPGACTLVWAATLLSMESWHAMLCGCRMTEGRLLGSFAAWRDHAQGQARHRRVAQQHFHFRERGQQAACLVNWQRVAVRRCISVYPAAVLFNPAVQELLLLYAFIICETQTRASF